MSDTLNPGTVAVVDSWRGKGQIAFRTHNDGLPWCVLDGTGTRGLDHHEVTAARPVIVLDLETDKDAERLYDVLVIADVVPAYRAGHIDKVLEALRFLAAPVPVATVDEPTGLGAVVEDRRGDHWVRHCLPTCEDGPACLPWRRVRDSATDVYENLVTVCELSPGWTPESAT
jgi:hypothetical protein